MNVTKTRVSSLFCAAGSHDFCPDGDRCDCSCHFEELTQHADLIGGVGYPLWRISKLFDGMPPAERREKILGIIRSTERLVDFQGLTAEEIYERFQPTIARDYWSMRETYDDFGFDFSTR